MPTASSPAPGDLTRRTGCQALEFDPEVAYSDEVVRAAGLYADDELLLDHSGVCFNLTRARCNSSIFTYVFCTCRRRGS